MIHHNPKHNTNLSKEFRETFAIKDIHSLVSPNLLGSSEAPNMEMNSVMIMDKTSSQKKDFVNAFN